MSNANNNTIGTQIVNRIKHVITGKDSEGNTLIAYIGADDDCKNGHIDFHITGDVYEAGKPKTDRYMLHCGAIADEIAKAMPDLTLLCRLHCCDLKGAPTYAAGNGFYHLKNSSKEMAMDYLRITPEEFTTVATAEDEKHLSFILQNMGIVDRWEEEAQQGIEQLEELTGLKLEDNSRRYQYIPLTPAEMAEMGNKIVSGYYSPASLQARATAKAEAQKAKALQSIKEDYDKAVNSALGDYLTKTALINSSINPSAAIYYKHTNTLTFNWNRERVTREQYDQFVRGSRKHKLPAGLKFEFKD